MQKISSSSKTVIIFVSILIIGALMYFYTIGGPTDSSLNSLEQQGVIGNVDTQIVGARVLSLLNQISSLKIDKKIFDDPLYKLLLDHTIDIPAQNVGRTNPFEPYYTIPVIVPRATTTRSR